MFNGQMLLFHRRVYYFLRIVAFNYFGVPICVGNLLFHLTNRMWFSVFCTLIDNDIRHHSGQNVVDSRGANDWRLGQAKVPTGVKKTCFLLPRGNQNFLIPIPMPTCNRILLCMVYSNAK